METTASDAPRSTRSVIDHGIPDRVPPLDRIERGYLLGEPCRYCWRIGGVWFLIDDSPFGRATAQVVACDHCKNTWTADTPGVPAHG